MRCTLLAMIAAFTASCSGVDYVEIEPSQVTLQRRGEVVWLRAKPMGRNGRYFPRVAVAWSCDNPHAVTVDEVGRVTAVGAGHAVCSAKGGGQTGTVEVEVQTVETVKIDPPSLTLTDGQDGVHPKVSLLDDHGHELKGRTIDMHSKDDNVANVDGEQIWPVAPGHTTVIVRADDRSSTIDVTVVKEKGGKKH